MNTLITYMVRGAGGGGEDIGQIHQNLFNGKVEQGTTFNRYLLLRESKKRGKEQRWRITECSALRSQGRREKEQGKNIKMLCSLCYQG